MSKTCYVKSFTKGMDRMKREWMYTRRLSGAKYLSDGFIVGMDEFIEFEQSQLDFVFEGKIRCPCLKCQNRVLHLIEDVKEHLYRRGFVANYYHGPHMGKPSLTMCLNVEVMWA